MRFIILFHALAGGGGQTFVMLEGRLCALHKLQVQKLIKKCSSLVRLGSREGGGGGGGGGGGEGVHNPPSHYIF